MLYTHHSSQIVTRKDTIFALTVWSESAFVFADDDVTMDTERCQAPVSHSLPIMDS